MPLLSIQHLDGDVTLALWRVTETVEEFQAALPHLPFADESHDGHRPCETRVLERYATHALLLAVTGSPETIAHLSSGKPVVSMGHVSVSHTRGYAAVIFSPCREVAVDIEYVSDRVDRVAHKFLRPDELSGGDTLSRLVAWCAKEAAYKYYSADELPFQDMRISPFSQADGRCLVENLRRGDTLSIHFRVAEDYVLAYGYQ